MLTLEETIEQILKHLPEYDKKDILEMIEQKRQELGPDVINDESAAMIVARELGVDLLQDSPRARTKIEELTEGTRNVTLTAKVVNVGTVRTFSRRDGNDGMVASIVVADTTGKIRVALWDDMTRAVSEGHVTVGSVVQIRGAYAKKGLRDSLELNLGSRGGLRVLEDDEAEDLDLEVPESEMTKLAVLEDGMYDLTVLVKVSRVFGLSTFTRKSDGAEGKVLSLMGADESGSRRIVFWDKHAEDMENVKEGEVVRITGTYTRVSRTGDVEVHSSRSSGIEREIKGKLESVQASQTYQASEPLGRKTISELTSDMRNVDVEGKVSRIFPPNDWEKDGKEGKVQNIFIVDASGLELRVTFWNETVELITDLKDGDVIRVKHGYVREREGQIELQLGRLAQVEINPGDSPLDQLELPESPQQTFVSPDRVPIGTINEDSEGKTIEVAGIVVGISQTSPVYPACPSCRKKAIEEDGEYECKTCGKVEKPDYRMAYKITVDDGSSSIKVTLFGGPGEKLMQMSAQEAQKLIEETKEENEPIRVNQDRILGRYITITGRVNKFRDAIEVTASRLEFTSPVEEVKKLRGEVEDLMD
ncbi:MAG: OB-fold nucleic acid binding domain-containing protein [Candidatus Thorarchaeota archaeon]